MALTATLVDYSDTSAFAFNDSENKLRRCVLKVNLGASYTTDGETFDASVVSALVNGPCTSIAAVLPGGPSADGAHWVAWDPTNEKLLSFTAASTQSSSGANLSATAKEVYCEVFFS